MDIWNKEPAEVVPAMEKQETHNIAKASDETAYETCWVKSLQEIFRCLNSYYFEFHGKDVSFFEKAHVTSCQSSATTMSMEEEKIDLPKRKEKMDPPQLKGPGNSQQSYQEQPVSQFGLMSQLFNYLSYIGLLAWPPFWYMSLILAAFAVTITGGQSCDTVLKREAVQTYDSSFVNFSGMHLSEIESEAFHVSQTVTSIDLSDNCLSNLHPQCFSYSTDLYELDLSNNSFYSINPAVKSASDLLHLYMSNNPISYVGKDDFKGMNQVTVIRFAQCLIENIHHQALDELKSLITADFSGTKLTVIPCIDIATVLNLCHMDFSNNLLESLNIPCFSLPHIVRNISITDDKMVVWTADKSIEFFISGNSDTLKCEKIEEDILNANVPVNCNLSCQFQNGSVGRIAQQTSGKYFSTPVTPGDHDLSTPSPDPTCNHGKVVVLTVLCVVFFLCFLAALVFIHKLRKAKP